ncbi:DUF4832 domain-containing protein [Rubrobacter indicoceani]|uniref:DUF4832 domain-containing protein n=1 Tax=Rubrobacter indicoceani TaxID=2051957 RepID=UPI000E5BE3AB|nr:DUF4832 domain-containing protein [Rubrobacter indicoceani]
MSRKSLLKGSAKALAAGAVASVLPTTLFASRGEAQTTGGLQKTFRPTRSIFPNPERGWLVGIDPLQNDYRDGDGRLLYRGNTTMQQVPPPGFEKYAHNEAKLREHRSRGVTLIRKYYLLYDYRSSYIPASYLADIVKDLELVRKCGLKLIPRFVYVWNESYEPGANQDASVTWITRHLEQLRPILNEHADVISFLETGLVGWYGEWHNSTNENVGGQWTDPAVGATYGQALNQNSMSIINKALEVLPTKRMMVLRLVHHVAQLQQDRYGGTLRETEAYGGSAKARIGLEDSSVLYNQTHRGGYWPPDTEYGKRAKESMRLFQETVTSNVVMTGEPSGDDGSGYVFRTDPIAEFERMHWDSMNNCWYEAERDGVYAHWRRTGAYNEIGNRLGYRFALLGASVTGKAARGGPITLTFDVENSGFSSPYNPRPVEVVLRRTTDGREFRLRQNNADPRRWKSGASRRVVLSGRVPKGMTNATYKVLLNFPDPEPKLYGRSEYSIRLANEGVWENATGFNDLGLLVRVSGSVKTTRRTASQIPAFEAVARQPRSDVPQEITLAPDAQL